MNSGEPEIVVNGVTIGYGLEGMLAAFNLLLHAQPGITAAIPCENEPDPEERKGGDPLE